MRTLRDVRQEIDHLIKNEWQSHYWSPLSSLARLTAEVGELAREINHRYGEKPKDALRDDVQDIVAFALQLRNDNPQPAEAMVDMTRMALGNTGYPDGKSSGR